MPSAAVLLALFSAQPSVGATDPAKNVNVAPFGFAWILASPEAGKAYAPGLVDGRMAETVSLAAGSAALVEWKQPRDIQMVILRGSRLPPAGDIDVQWWHRVWPDNGSGGWMKVDDPFNGAWVTVKAVRQAIAGGASFRFDPLDRSEVAGIEQAGAAFRRTYKVRIVFRSAADVSEIETYTAAQWKTAELKLEWKPHAGRRVDWHGEIEARNGRIEAVDGVGPVTIKLRYADSPDRLSEDRGYLVFRPVRGRSRPEAPDGEGFSVFVDDVVREGGVYVRDIDAFVSDASKGLTFAMWKGPADKWDATILERVASMPEQSLERAMKAMPPKPPREAHLGVPNMRQEFTIDSFGDIQLLKQSLRAPGRDLERRPWTEDALTYELATGESPRFASDGRQPARRSLEDGWLPVIRCEWEDGPIVYEKSSFATTLLEPIGEGEEARRGDEPLVLLSRIELRNASSQARTASLWLAVTPDRPFKLDGGLIVLDAPSDGKPRPGLKPVRGLIDTRGRGALTCVSESGSLSRENAPTGTEDRAAPKGVLRYRVHLEPDERHSIVLAIPYVELLDGRELAALRASRYEGRHDEVVSYWKKRAAEGMLYEVPEPILNHLFKANLWHVLISTDRDPRTGLYEHGAATMRYGNFPNETCMVARSLEMRGLPTDAFRLIEPFLLCQGVKPLPGNFASKDGLMYAAYPDPQNDPYTAAGYNMDHGWALWSLCEHYQWTRDAKWLASVATKLVAACDWITRERQATKVANPDGTRPVEWGLAPAGQLEDVEEYLYFYATNAYYYVGLKTAANVLAEIKHPEAARLAREAADYRADILASLSESVATSPVVRLLDGTYLPFVPPRAYALTHKKGGWVREGLYPALHLLDGDVLEPRHPFVTWLLQDLEDNIFLSEESGFRVKDLESQYFEFGGFDPQPNLLTNSHAHLRRDEVANFLRVFFNECAASLYPDTVCFAEWLPDFGQASGPLYKTPDESHFIQYMRNMLVFEVGDTLRLGMGVPRAWMADGKRLRVEKAATFFGSLDMTIISRAAERKIEAEIALRPGRRPARQVFLRLRHPEGRRLLGVTVDGKPWPDFDAAKELITLPAGMGKAVVVARY